MDEVKIEELNNVEDTVMENEDLVCSGKGILGKLAIGLGVVVIGGTVAFIYKNRDKIEQKRIEKLRKKGYVIYDPDEIDEGYDDEEYSSEDSE